MIRGAIMPEEIIELLPFLIPIIIIQFTLLGFTIYHILTHDKYKRGNRKMWLIISCVLCNFIGPILYFILGKED